MAIATLTIDIVAKLANLQNDLGRAAQAAEQTGKRFESAFGAAKGALGALGVALSAHEFIGWIKGTIDAADAAQDLSKRIGIGVRDLAAWQLAAKESGTTLEAVGRGEKNLANYIKDHGDRLKALGISTTDANKATLQLADIFHALPDGFQKTALATQLFGKAGYELIPMLNLGAQGLAELRAKSADYAERLATLAPKADEFNDRLAELGLAAQGAGINFTLGLIGPLTRAVEQFAEGEKLAGGFLAAIQLFGTINPFASLASNLKTVREELDALQQAKADMGPGGIAVAGAGIGMVSADNIDAQIAGAKKRLEFLKYQQRQEAALAGEGIVSHEGWSKGTPTTGTSAAQLAKAKAAADALLIKAGGGGAGQETSALQSLAEELAHAGGEVSRFDDVVARLTTGSWKNFSAEAKASALAMAGEIDETRAATAEKNRLAKAQEELNNTLVRMRTNLDVLSESYAADMEKMAGGEMPESQRKLAEAMRQVEERAGSLRKEISMQAAVHRDDTVAMAAFKKMMEEVTAVEVEQKKRVRELWEEQQRMNGQWTTGAVRALATYGDMVKDVAGQTEQVVTRAFGGMEDALVDFVTKGKLDFKSLADSIAADIARMAVRQTITGPLEQWLSAYMGMGGGPQMGMGGAIIGGTQSAAPVTELSTVFAGFAGGTDYVPFTGKYLLHQGERVTSASDNARSSRAASPVVINMNFSGATDRRSTAQAALEVGQAVQRVMRRNG